MTKPNSVHTKGMAVLQRGFFHGNVIAFWGDRLELVDTGYHTGTKALQDCIEALSGQSMKELSRVILTHVHSDHGGGVSTFKELSGCEIFASQGVQKLTEPWDAKGLWLLGMDQEMPIFQVDKVIEPGEPLTLGGANWEIFTAPGHATGGLGFFQPDTGVLIAGDALWEDGFGLLNPWEDGKQVFDEARQALDNIEACAPTLVIPGHGRPFQDVSGALTRARSKLNHLEKNPESLSRTSFRGMLGFWILSHPGLAQAALHKFLLHFSKYRTDFFPSIGFSNEPIQPMIEWLLAANITQYKENLLFPGKALQGMDFPIRSQLIQQ